MSLKRRDIQSTLHRTSERTSYANLTRLREDYQGNKKVKRWLKCMIINLSITIRGTDNDIANSFSPLVQCKVDCISLLWRDIPILRALVKRLTYESDRSFFIPTLCARYAPIPSSEASGYRCIGE
jgi:hypothetical protein